MRPLVWVLVGVVVLVAAVFGASWLFGADENRTTAGSVTTTKFTGVITSVESTGLNEVTSFEVRHDDTTTTVYVREDFDYGFPIGHLQEHLTSGDPITVEGEVVDGKLYADSIGDA